MVALAGQFGVVCRLCVEGCVFDGEKPEDGLLRLIGHAVPCRASGFTIACVVAEIGAADGCRRATQQRG